MIVLDNAVVYDIETFPNVFTFTMECLNEDFSETWEISEFRDDREDLFECFQWLMKNQIIMIGFNNLGFDYPIIHFLLRNRKATPAQIYEKADSIIDNFNDRFAHNIRASDRFAPQLDLFKLHHMDNHAKSTSLKALQINMRSKSVVDMPVEVGTHLTKEQVNELLIPYNQHDTKQTKQFAKLSSEAINFRLSLIEQFGIDVLNWSDTKIGSKIMEKRLNKTNKTVNKVQRDSIALNDVIFPYIHFKETEFKNVLDYFKKQVLTNSDMKELGSNAIKTKGVFKNIKANVAGLDFHFGTGGIHGSVTSQSIYATEDLLIRDIDVESLYPSIAIVNSLSPEHLGKQFVEEYAKLPLERKRWQKEKGKKCVEANTLKLASNGVYGNSNNPYSVFYDPQFTLTVTINGQLLLCMLVEKLSTIPTLKIIQINTDGITYNIHKDNECLAKEVCKEWQTYTKLKLEDVNYKRIWIRDVNSYVAEEMDGTLKLKGAYWTPDKDNYYGSIALAQPPAWHKDLSNIVSIRAAVEFMVNGTEPEDYIRACKDPYDFMCRIKVKRSDSLIYDCPVWGKSNVQKTSRYYVSTDGGELVKLSPPTGIAGMFKKKNGVDEAEYDKIMSETIGEWDERVCTANKSKYVQRETGIESGYKITLCNDVNDFSFDNVDYDWYIKEAKKLII